MDGRVKQGLLPWVQYEKHIAREKEKSRACNPSASTPPEQVGV